MKESGKNSSSPRRKPDAISSDAARMTHPESATSLPQRKIARSKRVLGKRAFICCQNVVLKKEKNNLIQVHVRASLQRYPSAKGMLIGLKVT